MTAFTDDDQGYLDWLSAHPEGYVLNASRPPRASYLKVHRVACGTITGKPANGAEWTRGYVKVCSESPSELFQWAQQHTGGTPTPCGQCKPTL